MRLLRRPLLSRPTKDPLFSQVVLLQHMEGSGVDQKAHTVTATNGATFSTSTKKFGSAAAQFDGVDDYLSLPNSSDWNLGTGDFTVEAWVYIGGNSPADGNGNRAASLFNTALIGGSFVNAWALQIVGNGSTTGTAIQLVSWSSGGTASILSDATAISQGAWHHIAVTRAAGTTRIFKNGVQTVSGSDFNGVAMGAAGTLRVGAGAMSGFMQPLNGYMDEVRITKGTARYTATFTPPTGPFPNL